MRPDQLDNLLRQWGSAQTARFETAQTGTRAHLLERARDFAPGTRERAAKALVDRSGRARRRIMASKAGVRHMGIVPKWACSPIPCTETRTPGPALTGGVVDEWLPDDLRPLASALIALYRHCPMWELVVRVQYTETGTQEEKAKIVARKFDGKLSYWQYRKALEAAMNWLTAKVGT